MTELTARIATTGIIEQAGANVLVDKQAIEALVAEINGERAVPLIVNHNPFSIPLGKLTEAWVEPFGNGYAAMVRIYIEETHSLLQHRGTGENLILTSFKGHSKAFVPKGYPTSGTGRDTVLIDLANFESFEAYQHFKDSLNEFDNSFDCENTINRYTVGPEPFIAWVLSDPVVHTALTSIGIWVLNRATKFVTHTVDQTLKKVGDELSVNLSSKLNQVLRRYTEHRKNDDRGTTTQITIRGDLELNLLVKTEVDEEFPNINLNNLVDVINRYDDILQHADSATFALDGNGDWKLQYLTTLNGETIGTPECYQRTRDELHRMGQSEKSQPDAESSDNPL